MASQAGEKVAPNPGRPFPFGRYFLLDLRICASREVFSFLRAVSMRFVRFFRRARYFAILRAFNLVR